MKDMKEKTLSVLDCAEGSSRHTQLHPLLPRRCQLPLRLSWCKCNRCRPQHEKSSQSTVRIHKKIPAATQRRKLHTYRRPGLRL